MAATWEEMALVGRIARAHGLRGQVIVNADTDFPDERFQPGAELFVKKPGAASEVLMTITTVRFHRDRPVIGFRGIDQHHFSSIHDVLVACRGRFTVEKSATLPRGVPLGWAPYGAVLLRKEAA